MSGIRKDIRRRISSPATSGCAATMSSTPWGGTRSDCLPSDTRCRPISIRGMTTEQNIATFRRQIKMLGLSYDWEREVDTTDPGYYSWTQWIFLQIYDSWFDPRARQGPADRRPCPRARVGREQVAPGRRAVHGRRMEAHDPEAEARFPCNPTALRMLPRSPSTGAKGSGRCWPTKKWPSGRKKGTRSSAARCASG